MARNEFQHTDQGAADFTEIVNQNWTAVYKLLYHLTGNRHDTEDLTQETFLRALHRFDMFQTGTNIRAWLLRIATNVFFDQQRKRQRVRPQPLPNHVAGSEPSPGHALEVREQAQLLRAALAELSELTRLVFHLRAQENLSFKEIAAIAGTSEQAARWHMHQARVRLLQRWQEHQGS